MQLKPFVGRKRELNCLSSLHSAQMTSLVVIKSRRRVGKRRLIAEFAAKNTLNKLWGFAGLAPFDGVIVQTQREHFARHLALILKLPPYLSRLE